MNHIHFLEGVKRDAHTLATQAQDELNELISYLCLPKFREDTTVQVQDIFNRIQQLRSTLMDLSYITQPKNTASRVHHFQEAE